MQRRLRLGRAVGVSRLAIRLAGCLMFLLAPAVVCAAPAAAPRSLPISVDDMPAAQQTASRLLLDTVAAWLPARFIEGLPADTRLGWRDLPAGVHGRHRGRQLWLEQSLWPAWQGESGASFATRSRSPAVRALIHELAHRYDRSAAGGVSRDPRFLDLAGWVRKPWAWAGRETRNGMTDRSPDAYELHSPAEYFAVNLEWYLLDPAYACRRPALARYFAERVGAPPHAGATCGGELDFAAPASGGGGSEWLGVDPARVYAIDYLLAEGNEQAMSRWGHSMLRLVICAPGRAPGPDCRLDLAHHRVLSFRAFVGDVQISSWRGLTGSYPSRLFVLPLDQVIDEYTRTELRGLQSIPLALSAPEIAGLLERAAQLHWSYDGRYYFIRNNCAVETWRLLQDGVPRLASLPLRGITPNGLARRLAKAGVADPGVLADRARAQREGYYFEALSARFDSLYAVAKRQLDLPQADADAWLDASPQQRAPWLPRGDLRSSAALLVLEEAALRRQQLRLRDVLKRRLLGGDEASSGHARAEVQQWLRASEFLSRPATLSSVGYGLPQPDERGPMQQRLAEWGARQQDSDRAMRELARQWLPAAELRELEAAEANVAVIGQRVRTLAGQ